MRVKDLMKTKVMTVSPDDRADKVFFMLNFEKIRHLPVVERDRVVGILSDRDLKKVLGSLKLRRTVAGKGEMIVAVRSRTVRTIMRRGVITISPNASASGPPRSWPIEKSAHFPWLKNKNWWGSSRPRTSCGPSSGPSGNPMPRKTQRPCSEGCSVRQISGPAGLPFIPVRPFSPQIRAHFRSDYTFV